MIQGGRGNIYIYILGNLLKYITSKITIPVLASTEKAKKSLKNVDYFP